MSNVTITPTPLGVDVPYRRVISPNHLQASYSTQDTNNNDIRFAAGGKSIITISIDNAPNKALTGYLYGMHEVDGDVGDAGVFLLDDVESISVALADKEVVSYVGYAFPYYLLRLNHAVQPDDGTPKAVSVFIDINH